jgi:mRNA interferase RelE/StbE
MKVIYNALALKQLKKLSKKTSNAIISYMEEVEKLEDPRSRGKALTGNLKGFWRYRVEDYRVLCKITDTKLLITVVKVGHRSSIYKI